MPRRLGNLRILAAAAVAALGVLPLAAQAPRLLDCVESPMLYVSLGAEAGPDAAAGQPRGAVQSLLADPALGTLLGGADAGTAGGRALALVRGLLSRSTGELELALTGVVPSSGQPLLLLRLRLQAAETARLRELLDGPDLATPSRRLGAHAAYALRSRDAVAEPRPGQQVELALVGADLFVGNDGTAIEEALVPAPATTAAAPRRLPLGRDPRFTALRERLDAPAGALLVYGDWQRLRQRWQDRGGPFLLASSGLGGARTAMAALAPRGASFSATLLLDFAVEPGAAGEPRGRHDHDRGRGLDNWIDGWFVAAQSVPARTLLPELPGGGLGGLVLAVDLDDLARRSQRGAGVLHTLHDALREHGLDFDRSVLGRLGTRGSVLLPLSPSAGGAADAEVAVVYALRAKSRKAATDLFDDVRRAVEGRGSGRVLAGRDRRGDVLELRGHGRHRDEPPAYLAVADDSLLLGLDAEAVARLADEVRRAGRARSKRDAAVAQAVQSIGGEAVTGLFDLDLQPWFAQLARTLAPAGASLDFSAIPQRHTGFLSLQPRDGGMLLRIGVLSSR